MKTDKLKKLIIALISGCLLAISIPGIVFAADTEDEKEISIDLAPDSVLFDVDNMKPGDWAPRDIVIQNRGEHNFEYIVTIQNESDSEKLFNELMLEVNAKDEELYSGKLKEFNELSNRNLASMDVEKLQFIIRFPEHLGNEYQGLQTNFSILFIAEGEERNSDNAMVSGLVGSDGGSQGGGLLLPDTATNTFTILLIGVLLAVCGGLILFINKRINNFKKPGL